MLAAGVSHQGYYWLGLQRGSHFVGFRSEDAVLDIDLRSDTVTKPSPEMRRAMYEAEVGDDVYGEDPTMNRLQERMAELTGKEAALFVPSGTMGNLVSILTHCGRGTEAIMGSQSHTFWYEGGGSSALGGVHVHTVLNQPDGTMDPVEVERAVRVPNVHFPRTSLICLENTHNRCGGVVLSVEQMAAIREVADRHGLPIHLDGARIFNAAIALGVQVSELTALVDTVQICFSKGLAAPVGSIVCGPQAFVDEAIRNRKMLGGGMRQAGVLAAAALYAVDNMVERLADDHANACYLAERVLAMPGVTIDPATVQTNMVRFELTIEGCSATDVVARLNERGVHIMDIDERTFRAVTHYGVEREDMVRAADELEKALCSIA